jgi:glycosyltransferase involved in cell wall biosynthesis
MLLLPIIIPLSVKSYWRMLPNLTNDGIIRDFTYRKTIWGDSVRQRLQRTTKVIHNMVERWWTIPCVLRPKTIKNKTALTLSTAIFAMDSAHRLQPLLAYVRSFSDQVVVGVDSASTDDTWLRCQQWQAEGLIDVLFNLDNTTGMEQARLEQLLQYCSGDWIFRLDDDEYPEPAFAKLKPALIATTTLTHYKIPRLHICQTKPLKWINDSYLYPDYQIRLFRNDPALLSDADTIGCKGQGGNLHTLHLVRLHLASNPRMKREHTLRHCIEKLNGVWIHPINERTLLFENFNYNQKTYQCPDRHFWDLITQVCDHQRQLYERAIHSTLPIKQQKALY